LAFLLGAFRPEFESNVHGFYVLVRPEAFNLANVERLAGAGLAWGERLE
jgi:hypothetical protein